MERIEKNQAMPQSEKRIIVGVILMIIGVLFLADNFSFLPHYVEEMVFTWQMLLIAIGIVLVSTRENKVSGGILIIVGIFFLLPKMFWFDFDFRRLFWPVILIGAGVLVLINAFKKNGKHFHSETKTMSDFIDEVAIFGGGERRITSKNFSGGKATVVFGGLEFSFADAKLGAGLNVLDVTAIFGGITIRVPRTWNVKVEVNSILGGFSDKRVVMYDDSSESDCELVIRGTVLFGGGEIKSI
jgi:predicted membrane protein